MANDKRRTNSHELHSRMDEIDDSFPDPGPEIWPKAARVIKAATEDCADILAMCGITPDGARA